MAVALSAWAGSRVPPGADHAIRVHADAIYLHKKTQIQFPARVGAFERGRITAYDAEARDIGIGFNEVDSKKPVIITAYVYPPPDLDLTLADHFDKVKDAIKTAQPKAKELVQEKAMFKMDGKMYAGLHAALEYKTEVDGKATEVITRAYLFEYGKWMIKFRITYQKDVKAHAEKIVDEFLEKLNSTL